MRTFIKILLVAIIGCILAGGGAFLRLNAKNLSMRSAGATKMTDENGKVVGSAVWQQEDTSQSSALAGIGIVLLSCGGALVVVAAAGWVFARTPTRTELQAA